MVVGTIHGPVRDAMTIARRIIASSIAFGVGILITAGSVVAAVLTLQRVVAGTREEFHELCDLREIAAHTRQAERFITNGHRDATVLELHQALSGLAQFQQFQKESPSAFEAQHSRNEEEIARRVYSLLAQAEEALTAKNSDAQLDAKIASEIERAETDLIDLMGVAENAVEDAHSRAERRFNSTLWLLLAIESALIVVGFSVSLLLYRNVVSPLRGLRSGTDRLAEGKLETRVELNGDREFVDLQRAFNDMASEMELHCQTLERRVAEKGRELAVAERLASVGFLAAGVAHEINNPLAIMSGYAESLLRMTSTVNDNSNGHTWRRDLETIRDEAFRCKRITQSLLDLSRLGDDHREPVELTRVIDNCISLISAWPASRGVTIETNCPADGQVMTLASEPEIKQVLLNLLVNAIEATTSTKGKVSVGLSRNNGWVELVVRDNGHGMTQETLSRAFEPFYSTGKPRTGLGLGLSISHAIARRHQGSLEAYSDGPGLGATVTLRLPALKPEFVK